MAEITLLEAVNLALHHEMKHDPQTVILGEDIGTNGGVFRATVGLREKFGLNALLILLWLKHSLLVSLWGWLRKACDLLRSFNFKGLCSPPWNTLCVMPRACAIVHAGV